MYGEKRMTEKRFIIQLDNLFEMFCVVDVPNERVVARLDTKRDAEAVVELLEIFEGLR